MGLSVNPQRTMTDGENILLGHGSQVKAGSKEKAREGKYRRINKIMNS